MYCLQKQKCKSLDNGKASPQARSGGAEAVHCEVREAFVSLGSLWLERRETPSPYVIE